MKMKQLIFVAFVVVALVQLSVPAKMIFDQEEILSSGKEFKFKSAPFDPEDPFRGKYIDLSFQENSFPIQNADDWNSNDEIYVQLTTDSNGYAVVKNVSKNLPEGNMDYVKAKVDYVANLKDYPKKIFIDYPFNRFYLEEFKAPKVDSIYRKALRDTTQDTYALIKIKEGKSVIEDVMVGQISITKLLSK